MTDGAKVKVFIGSSTESSGLAEAVHHLLKSKYETIYWADPKSFRLSMTTIESLMKVSERVDFAILFHSPDDRTKSRGRLNWAPRDNTIFESGLFMGALGRERVFLLGPANGRVKNPSDLFGVTFGAYGAETNPIKAVGPACEQIATIIDESGPLLHRPRVARYAAAVCYRMDDATPKFLLVKTTGGRWTIPKGVMQYGENTNSAAVRHASNEAGVLGIIRLEEEFKYINSKSGHSDQHITAHLVEVRSEDGAPEPNRNPTWFDRYEAEARLSERRLEKDSFQLRRAIQWASDRIAENPSLIHRLAGSLPYRISRDGVLEILLVTSRINGNWVVPKGHIFPGERPRKAVKRETYEESGVQGQIGRSSIGRYTYRRNDFIYDVEMYSLLVEREFQDWPEQDRRQRRWMTQQEAASIANEAALRDLIARFTPPS